MRTCYDAGLQRERTALAWRRTCLGQGIVSLLLLRIAISQQSAVLLAASALTLLLAGGVAVVTLQRCSQARLLCGKTPRLLTAGLSLAIAITALATLGFLLWSASIMRPQLQAIRSPLLPAELACQYMTRSKKARAISLCETSHCRTENSMG